MVSGSLSNSLTSLVLLSLNDAAWKITDFGLTAEGTSRRAYTTQWSRGTESYRGPELLREGAVVSMRSDIWALGCILYELLFGKKAFPRDFHAFEFASNKRRPDIPIIPELVDERLNSVAVQLTCAMLDSEWWKRPTARDLLKALSSLCEEATDVCVLACRERDTSHQDMKYKRLSLHHGSSRWKSVVWKRYWFVPYTFPRPDASTKCESVVAFADSNPNSENDLKHCPVCECRCLTADKPLIDWAFVVNENS